MNAQIEVSDKLSYLAQMALEEKNEFLAGELLDIQLTILTQLKSI